LMFEMTIQLTSRHKVLPHITIDILQENHGVR
jgi:hypothetical protein